MSIARTTTRLALLLGVALTAVLFFSLRTVFADATSSILPTADGNYTQWSLSTGTSHFALVDESSCNGSTDYNFTTTVGNRDSYSVSIAGIPDGSTITQIDIRPCASRQTSGGANPVMNVFYRFSGVNSSDAGSYSLSATTPADLATTSYSGLSLAKGSSSTLEIGAILTSGTKGARLSRISTVVTYTPPAPAAPSSLSSTASTSTPAIALSWADNSSVESNFEVLRGLDGASFSHLATTSANITAYNNTGLATSTTYYYQVRAYNSGGYSTVSNTASSTTI